MHACTILATILIFHGFTNGLRHDRLPRRAPTRRANEKFEMVILVPDGCWWGAPGASTEFGVCEEDMDITLEFTTKTSSQANFIFGGLHQSGTAELPSGTIVMVPDDKMSCTGGWIISPTADVTFSMPASASTHYTSLITSGGAYFACETPVPTAMPSASASAFSSTSGTPSSAQGHSISSSFASSTASSRQSGSASVSARASASGIASASASLSSGGLRGSMTSSAAPRTSVSASANAGNGDDPHPQGQVWLTIPDPHVSVFPHTAVVGEWNAAGPFAHLFSFHAWVPTYLNETFDISVLEQEVFVSKAMCSIGLTARPSGTEIVTYTLASTSPWVHPSGDVNGAYLHC
ncbi:hypothetical protein BD324DRAFT_649599 [Kockovaella imperatae]|uniref:Uncharacterized protein n=1 Tax=Kockovaella imperatae TaxID=4999 RepID=A0A1Y1UJH8_9TREE|nr:hypothetical protein BD324DRAFT_649599 [Kockovaella imperatae]ORX38220.1 hypothetical protein BD324DRAFT_649599 [Kockovaella imperatae]